MLEKAKALGMTESEYQKVLEILGREPSPTELAMYSVEWSEHCGYPRSRALLKTLPKTGHYASIAGADTGGIEIERGVLVVFKMESHNHPSQVEPKQGAATGIGGCVRDIFTVGARPIACLNSLRFGDLDDPKARYLLAGVVEGISWYGNCLGVPTVGGEVGFNDCYKGNCLVGAMAVGVVKADTVPGKPANDLDLRQFAVFGPQAGVVGVEDLVDLLPLGRGNEVGHHQGQLFGEGLAIVAAEEKIDGWQQFPAGQCFHDFARLRLVHRPGVTSRRPAPVRTAGLPPQLPTDARKVLDRLPPVIDHHRERVVVVIVERQRHGSPVVSDEPDLAMGPSDPARDLVGICDRRREADQLDMIGAEDDRFFPGRAPVRIGRAQCR